MAELDLKQKLVRLKHAQKMQPLALTLPNSMVETVEHHRLGMIPNLFPRYQS